MVNKKLKKTFIDTSINWLRIYFLFPDTYHFQLQKFILRDKTDRFFVLFLISVGLVTSGNNVMCFPFSISATCCSSTDMTAASFTFSKVVLTSEETKQYQLPWEKQQQEFSKKRQRSSCICWCCLCTCLW